LRNENALGGIYLKNDNAQQRNLWQKGRKLIYLIVERKV
jgi:hypothetical protein